MRASIMLCVWVASAVTGSAQSVRRTPDGRPDLQGFWDNNIITPVQRPKEADGKAVLTESEAAEFLARLRDPQRFRQLRGEVEFQTTGEVNGIYADTRPRWLGADRRTSLIVDPPEGTVPPLTSAGKARVDARAAAERDHPPDGPEDFILSERCLLWGATPPMIPVPYNNYFKIVQTRDTVMIANEMIHDVRVIPLDGRPHLPPHIRLWKGDPRGFWDGDTLVVETTNFTDRTSLFGSGPHLRVVERFTRTGPDSLSYEVLVDDPESFTRQWKVAWTMESAKGPLYEYACHEGNYSMENMLRGARASEKR